MENKYPNVLIISHNVFSKNTSMGKTLATYFHNWDKSKIAQLYFHSEIPTTNVCINYYRFTDVDALKSIIIRWKHGQRLTHMDVDPSRITSIETGSLRKIYNYGRKRSPLIYLVRDLMWKLSAWRSRNLYTWIKDFSPDVIFFASGDYSFSYRIAYKIHKDFDIPLVTCCFDDYYLFNINNGSILGRIKQRFFMHTVHKTFAHTNSIFTVSESMAKIYSKIFNKDCHVLYTGAKNYSKSKKIKKQRIVYLGGLSLGRNNQLIDIGRALKKNQNPNIPKAVDVYSGETDSNILNGMTLENGIVFHGKISGDEVPAIIRSSMVVIHTESFNEAIRQRVKYSISTKIPDCLASGTCIFAYGPRGIASIDYLANNQAAIVVNKKEQLKDLLEEAFLNSKLRETVINNALILAKKNHSLDNINELVRTVLLNASSQIDNKG